MIAELRYWLQSEIGWIRSRVWLLDRRVGWCDRRTEGGGSGYHWQVGDRRQPWWPRRFVDRNRTRACFCPIPPEGWRCSRGAGHTGPCAARPLYERRDPYRGGSVSDLHGRRRGD